MADDPIVFIDSGVGGLPYLKMARIYMPGENFVYVADNKNFPYGEKNANMLKEIILELIQNIVDKISPKLVVIAWNTASVVALSLLREKFGIPFVGVVPAIKPAGKISENGSIGLLATRKTVDDPYTDTLIEQFASTCRVEKYAGIDLVEFVENSYFTSTENDKMVIVSKAWEYFINCKIDALVLGCTHFVYLKDHFNRSLGSSVDIIDSQEGVSKQILRIIQRESLQSNNKTKDLFFITGSKFDQSNYLQFADEYGLLLEGRL
ncbi:MAG: glutamate racemase [Spirochaetales bacterium]|nr:glutamate racemase [Spirochaetales bacterium]